jgi:hypothetical protein
MVAEGGSGEVGGRVLKADGEWESVLYDEKGRGGSERYEEGGNQREENRRSGRSEQYEEGGNQREENRLGGGQVGSGNGGEAGGLGESLGAMAVVSKVDWANRWKRWRRGGGRRWMLKLETTSHRRANGGYRPFTPGYQFRLSTTTMPPLRKDVQRRVLPGCATIVGRIGSLRRFIER